MEVRESATCAVAEREFVVNLSEDEIKQLYLRLKSAHESRPHDELLEELLKQIEFVVGVAP